MVHCQKLNEDLEGLSDLPGGYSGFSRTSQKA
jgi:hypothetical protein